MGTESRAESLETILGLKTPAIAISFMDSPPQGIDRIDKAAASGCTYWKLAADGQVFYTEESDHYRCPIGAYTHGVDLPEEKALELQSLIGTMTGLEYLREDEVAGIPRRQKGFRYSAYAPLDSAPFEADIILIRGNARQLMLLSEAANAAGLAEVPAVMGRPTCAMLPIVEESGRWAASLGCIGNRVYTELSDDEFYFAMPGDDLGKVTEKLETIVRANKELEKYHLAAKAG